MKTTFLTLAVICFGCLSAMAQTTEYQAQNPLEEGYIIRKDGSRIEGFVSSVGYNGFGDKIGYQSTQDSPRETFRPDEILLFGHTSSQSIFKYVIRQPWFNPQDSSGVFMEELVSGPQSLFAEQYEGRYYFYVVTPDRVQPLIGGWVDKEGKPTNQPTGTSREVYRYRDQLGLLLPDVKGMASAINRAKHDRNGLIKVFEVLVKDDSQGGYTLNPAAIRKPGGVNQILSANLAGGLSSTSHYYDPLDATKRNPFSTGSFYRAGVNYRVTSPQTKNLMGEVALGYSYRTGKSGVIQYGSSTPPVVINPIHALDLSVRGFYRFSLVPMQPSVFLGVSVIRPLTDAGAYFNFDIAGVDLLAYDRPKNQYSFMGGLLLTVVDHPSHPVQVGVMLERQRFNEFLGPTPFRDFYVGLVTYVGLRSINKE